jgi:4-hydroxybenzoate-CoA ligase
VAFWGTIRAGAVAIPLNTYLPVPQYAYILADCRARVLVVDAALAATIIAPVLDKLPRRPDVIVVGDGQAASSCPRLSRASTSSASTAAKDVDGRDKPGHDGKRYAFEDLIAGADTTPFTADTLSDEVAFWLYTSGSTGDPKGVKHCHSNLMATAKLFGQGILGIRENDVVHSASKLFFAYGLGNAMTFPLSVGATAALWPHRPSPEGVFETLRRNRVTIFYGVPSLYTALLSHQEICQGAGSDCLRICVSAGEALPAHIGERWRSVVGVDVLDGLGSTEMLNTFLSNRLGDIRYGSTGKPVPGYNARIVDEYGREVGDGEIGELIVRGPSAGEGYWNQRAKSRRTFAGEWTHTGDKYRRDAEGYYYYCGRTDDMFKVSGMWVSPFDVEAALVSHEAVLEAAVIGKEDADGLIKPKAFIVLRNGYRADDGLLETLKVHVKDKAGPWKFPRWIELRTTLPRTATGKIQRFRLREEDRQTSAQ